MIRNAPRPGLAPGLAPALALLVAGLSAGLGAQQGPLTPVQVMSLRRVVAVYPSPDGAVLAFTRSAPRPAGDGPGPSYTHLYSMPAPGGDERLLIGGKENVRGVAWQPDGAMITFLHQGEGDEHREVWGIPKNGGEPVRITTTPRGIDGYAWRPDGQAIAYTVEDPPPPARAAARAMGFEQRVVDEDFDQVSLWLWEKSTGRSRRLTEGVTVFDFEWSPTGTHLAAGIAPRNLVDDRYMFQRLHLIVPGEDKVELLVDNPGKLGDYAWSPDGQTLAFAGAADRRDPHAGTLYTVRLDDRQPRVLTGDLEGMVEHVGWRSDEEILAAVAIGVDSLLCSIDLANGERETLCTAPDVAFDGFEQAGGRTFTVASSPAHPDEVFAFGDDGLVRLTESNPWLEDVDLGRQEVVRYEARDGLPIEGLLIHPLHRATGERRPLVLIAHGGPESHYPNGWLTRYSEPGQVLAGMGYFAWYPNYRSSTGRGVAFAKADHGDPMGREFEDHLDAIAYFARKGLVDETRVGVIGGSYGGYTAAWAATFGTEHFAAAVSFVPFVDIRTKWYTTDIPWEFFFVHYQEKWPHQQPGLLADRSPLTWAPRCRTPLLVLGGTSDPRVHPSQPFMLYRAVKTATDTPCRYVQYPGEGHGNRTNVYQYDYLVRSIRWLDHYLEPGDHRQDPPPPLDLDDSALEAFKATK